MNDKPTLFVERLPCSKPMYTGTLAFDFCYTASMGAAQMDVPVHSFEDVEHISSDPTNVLVGSVEMCSKWLTQSGYQVPKAISLELFKPFLGRNIVECTMEDVRSILPQEDEQWQSFFIKPSRDIKAFTGFVATTADYLDIFAKDFSGYVYVQDVLSDIHSEYRVFVSNNRIIGMKHYFGDYFIYPDPNVIKQCVEIGNQLDYHSYCLDFGVLSSGETICIEANDGWALASYGLGAKEYYLFVRNRWLQMTGIRYRMEHT